MWNGKWGVHQLEQRRHSCTICRHRDKDTDKDTDTYTHTHGEKFAATAHAHSCACARRITCSSSTASTASTASTLPTAPRHPNWSRTCLDFFPVLVEFVSLLRLLLPRISQDKGYVHPCSEYERLPRTCIFALIGGAG